MTSQTGKARVDWRRAVVGGVLTVGLMSGFGVSTAFAQPAEPSTTTTPPTPEADGPRTPCTGEDCNREEETPAISADAVLSTIYNEYRQGDGGGQISKLIDDAVKLRRQGFRPSNANAMALAAGLESRPNQKPLVDALQATVAYQRKIQAQASMSESSSSGSAGRPPSWAPVPGQDNNQFLPPEWDINPYN